MREILFRGKAANGEWVYGIYGHGHKIIRQTGELSDAQDFICPVGGTANVWYVVDSVGQYTGLKDKNGNKIFEGDILETEGFDGTVYRDVVCFGRFNDDDNRGTEYIGFYVKSGNYTTSLLEMPLGEHNYCGVIGNIYDNPELIPEE